MKSLSMFRALLLIFSCTFFLTSCPEDSNNSLPGSQWVLVSIDSVAAETLEQIEFTADQVEFYEDFGSCWDYSYQTYEIDGDSLIMNGGDYSVGFELDGAYLHILTEGGSEWVYSEASFDASSYNICQAAKRSANWNAVK